jgi:hypothetical protein
MSEIINSPEYFDYRDLLCKILSVKTQKELPSPEKMPGYINFGPLAKEIDYLVETMIKSPESERRELAKVAARSGPEIYFSPTIFGTHRGVTIGGKVLDLWPQMQFQKLSPNIPFLFHTHPWHAFYSPTDLLCLTKPLGQGGVIVEGLGTPSANYMFVRTSTLPEQGLAQEFESIVSEENAATAKRFPIPTTSRSRSSEEKRLFHLSRLEFARRMQEKFGFVVYKGKLDNATYMRIAL